MRLKTAITAIAALLALGCAPAGAPRTGESPTAPSKTHAAHGDLPVWRLEELARATDPVIALRSPDGIAAYVQTVRVQRIAAVATRIAAAAGVDEAPDWLLVGSPAINAFAAHRKGRPVIGVTLGMLNLLKDDEDAWGALLGHELAHFRLGHHETQRSRKQALTLGSSLAGLALSIAGLGFGSLAADTSGTLVERAYSRDDERDADRTGFEYVKLAALDPRGALRLHQRLHDARSGDASGFFSTHPSGADRVEAMQRLLEAPLPSK